MQGQFEAAIADYTQALALNPGHCRTLYNRASCYDRLQRLPEAAADYSAAIALDQGSARAFYTRRASTCTFMSEVVWTLQYPHCADLPVLGMLESSTVVRGGRVALQRGTPSKPPGLLQGSSVRAHGQAGRCAG
jgi:tetratricopeptide (TPR) repeat protein